jgi:hypothetical protein
MKHHLTFALSLLTFASALFTPGAALAVCKNDMPDGKCEPETDIEDCACDDCLAACSGECTAANPACTQEDSCVCSECWMDEACNNTKFCKDDSDCEFFQEGCCCADCAMLAQCTGFTGMCSMGSGGASGSGGSAGSAASAGSAGSSGSGGSAGPTGSGGTGGIKDSGGCGCRAAGSEQDSAAVLLAAALALVCVSRKGRPRAPSGGATARR